MKRLILMLILGAAAGAFSGVALAEEPVPVPTYQIGGQSIVLDCVAADPENKGGRSIYTVALTIGVDADGSLINGVESAESNGVKEPAGAINDVTAVPLGVLEKLSEAGPMAVFVEPGEAGRPHLAIAVEQFGEDWIVTEGVFCEADDIKAGG